MLFRIALRRATRIGLLDGKIQSSEAERIYDALRRSRRRFKTGSVDVIDELETELLKDVPEQGAIDWGKLLQWLVDNLPAILSLLALFLDNSEPE